MSGIPCAGCGRFLAAARPIVKEAGEGYGWHEYLAEVRGDCKRCGPDVLATRESDSAWWLDWDGWTWTEEATA